MASKESSLRNTSKSLMPILTIASQNAAKELARTEDGEARTQFNSYVIKPLINCANSLLSGLEETECQGCVKKVLTFLVLPFEEGKSEKMIKICEDCFRVLSANYLNFCLKRMKLLEPILLLETEKNFWQCNAFKIFVECLYKDEYDTTMTHIEKGKKAHYDPDTFSLEKGRPEEIDKEKGCFKISIKK